MSALEHHRLRRLDRRGRVKEVSIPELNLPELRSRSALVSKMSIFRIVSTPYLEPPPPLNVRPGFSLPLNRARKHGIGDMRRYGPNAFDEIFRGFICIE